MNFVSALKKIINTGQSRSIVVTGNVYDLFASENHTALTKYVPLIDLLIAKCKVDPVKDKVKGIVQLVWRLNRPVEVIGPSEELAIAWSALHPNDKGLLDRLQETNDNSAYAFEIMRQVAECSRRANLSNNLIMLIEAADFLLPECEISRMALPDRKRIAIVADWFCDPNFINGHDTAILIAESRSLIHPRISRLPQLVSVEVPLPDKDDRYFFILGDKTSESYQKEHRCELADELAEPTAGLSLHAIRQLLRSGDYTAANVASKVEDFMSAQLGDGVVEFKRPTHTLDDCVGFQLIKEFMRKELIPAFQAKGEACISGVLVGGSIGSGKTYLCEALASELTMPVIVLKNIRSKWFGETDQIFERLRRLLETFNKIMIFVDEADTMFGDVESDHDTERRLTGKIQAMMSDPALRGKVIWLLMTARVHRLSPDIRRPGRMDLIIPILDPEDGDRVEFINWAIGEQLVVQTAKEIGKNEIWDHVLDYSPASFSLLRNRIKTTKPNNSKDLLAIIKDIVSPDISEVREYQSLQARVNCTRRSMLVRPEMSKADFDDYREKWKKRIRALEAKGIR
jgi:hypothetical protein